MANVSETNYRNRRTGKVVKINAKYAAAFPGEFELLGDEYEEDKVVLEGPPASSAKKEDWIEYALAQGHDVPDGLTKDEIKALVQGEDQEA